MRRSRRGPCLSAREPFLGVCSVFTTSSKYGEHESPRAAVGGGGQAGRGRRRRAGGVHQWCLAAVFRPLRACAPARFGLDPAARDPVAQLLSSRRRTPVGGGAATAGLSRLGGPWVIRTLSVVPVACLCHCPAPEARCRGAGFGLQRPDASIGGGGGVGCWGAAGAAARCPRLEPATAGGAPGCGSSREVGGGDGAARRMPGGAAAPGGDLPRQSAEY